MEMSQKLLVHIQDMPDSFEDFYETHFGHCPFTEEDVEVQVRRMCRLAWNFGAIAILKKGRGAG